MEAAPPGTRMAANGETAQHRQAFHGEYLYEASGFVFHQPVNDDREFFEITPGHRGQAIFLKGAAAKTVELEFKLTMLTRLSLVSSTGSSENQTAHVSGRSRPTLRHIMGTGFS